MMLDSTHGSVIPQLRVLLLDDGRKIDFDPTNIRRQRHSVGTGVQTGTQIDDRVDTRLQGFADQPIYR